MLLHSEMGSAVRLLRNMITRSMITRNVVHTGRFYVWEHIFYTAKRTGSSGPSDKTQ